MSDKNLLEVAVDGGKYTVIQKADGSVHALRGGERWRDCTGDKLVLCLAQRIEGLIAELDRMTEARNIYKTDGDKALAEIQKLRETLNMPRPWPDIGPDPLAERDKVKPGLKGSIDRLRQPVCLQQKEVPDQTALVYRIDVSRLLDQVTWLNAYRRYQLPDQKPCVPPAGDEMLVDVNDCARCQQNHDRLEFKPLVNASPVATHWAFCPVSGQPIFANCIKEPNTDEHS